MNIREKITPNIMVSIYFVAPIIIGIALSELFFIDISDMARNSFGYLQFLAKAGFNMKTKSVIFVMYIVFSPLAWFYLVEHRRRTMPYALKKMDKASVKKLLFVIFGSIIILLIGIYILIIGANNFSPNSVSRGIKLILYSARWNVSFGILSGSLILFLVTMLFTTKLGCMEIYIRLKKH